MRIKVWESNPWATRTYAKYQDLNAYHPFWQAPNLKVVHLSAAPIHPLQSILFIFSKCKITKKIVQGPNQYSRYIKSNLTINVMYCFSIISRSTNAIFEFQKTEKLVRDCSEYFDSSPLWSVRLRFGFNGWMFGAKFVQPAMGNCLQFCLAQ